MYHVHESAFYVPWCACSLNYLLEEALPNKQQLLEIACLVLILAEALWLILSLGADSILTEKKK